MSYISGLSTAANAAPSADPSAVVAAAGAPDPELAAQIIAQGQEAQAQHQADAENRPTHRGFFGSVLHLASQVGNATGVTPIVTGISSYMAKPLQEVQRDYRFLHETYAKHGFFAGLGATLPIVAGGALGSLLGPEGTILGADLAGAATRQVLGSTVLQDANAASANDHVSAGRDLAHLFGIQNTNSGAGMLLSGATDAAFDLGADPLIKLGAVNRTRKEVGLGANAGRLWQDTAAVKAVRALAPGTKITDAASIDTAMNSIGNGRGIRNAVNDIANSNAADIVRNYPTLAHLAGPLGTVNTPQGVVDVFKSIADNKIVGDVGTRVNAVGSFMAQNGLRLDSTADVENAFRTNPAVNAAADHIATLDTPQAVVDHNPDLAPIATQLSKAKTADDVQDVMRQNSNIAQVAKSVNNANYLPSRTITRIKASQLSTKIQSVGSADDAGPLASKFSNVVRTFTQTVPFSVDRDGNINVRAFDPNGPDAGRVVGQIFSLGFSKPEALYWQNKFIQAGNDVALKKSIYAQGLIGAAKAYGIPDDAKLVQDFAQDLQASQRGDFATEGGGKFGHGPIAKDDVNSYPVVDPETSETARTANTALWENQRGMFSMPDFRDWVQIKRKVEADLADGVASGRYTAGKYRLGQMDDWLYKRYTAAWFKPGALVNSGFAERIAMSELIPQISRFGLGPTLQSMIQAQAVQRAYKLEHGEDGMIANTMAHMFQGFGNMAKAPAEKVQLASDLVFDHESHMLAGPIARTGGNESALSNIAVERATAGQRALVARNQPFELMTPGSENYNQAYHAALSKMTTQAPARAIAKGLQGLTDEEIRHAVDTGVVPPQLVADHVKWLRGEGLEGQELTDWQRESQVVSRYNDQLPEQFAAHRIDSVLNLVYGKNGTVHRDLLDGIAGGDKPSIDMVEAIPPEYQPEFIPGRADPTAIHLSSRPFAKLFDLGFKKLVDPIINGLSRNPLYLNATWRHFEPLAVGPESAVARGFMSRETALQVAQERAAVDILPQIHNTALRSQASVLASNIFPFYFAQEQAYKRAFKAGTYNPALIRHYQQIQHSYTNTAFVHTDSQGNKSYVLPLAGGAGSHFIQAAAAMGLPLMSGLPMTFSGNMSSFKTVVPTASLPGLSPLVSMSAHAVTTMFPEARPAVQKLIGDQAYNSALIDEIMPNTTIKSFYRGVAAPTDDSQFASQMKEAMTAAAARGDLPDQNSSPAERQKFIDKIKNDARSAMFMKGIVSLFSPTAVTPHQDDFGFKDEYYKMLAANKGDHEKTMQQFSALHSSLKDPQAYTVATSKSAAGVNIPTSQAAINYLEQHSALMTKYSAAAPFLVPQTSGGGDASLLYNEELTLGLRAKETPEELLNSFYQSAGNNDYYANRNTYLSALAQLTGNHDALAQLAKGSDQNVDAQTLETAAKRTPQGQQIIAGWAEWSKMFNLSHPIWYDNFASTSRTSAAVNAVQQLYTMAKNNEIPAGGNAPGVLSLTNGYFKMLSMVNSVQGQTNAAGALRKSIEGQWQLYLQNAAATNPELQNVIQQVFNRLPYDINSYAYMVSGNAQQQPQLPQQQQAQPVNA